MRYDHYSVKGLRVILYRNRSNDVTTGRRVRCSNPFRSKRFSVLPKVHNISGYRPVSIQKASASFPGSKDGPGVKLTIQLHLVARLRMSGILFPLLLRLNNVDRGNCTFFRKRINIQLLSVDCSVLWVNTNFPLSFFISRCILHNICFHEHLAFSTHLVLSVVSG